MTKKQLEISELIHKAILTKENKADEKFCSQNTIWSTIETFNYNPEEDKIFERFYQNKKVKMQLDSGSDISIINTKTWKNIGKPTLLKSNKIARTVTGRKINFVGEGWLNIHFNNKIKKMRIFVVRNTNNLFGTDAITKFNLWDLPISSFCNKIKEYKDDLQIIKDEIKKTFPEVFSEGFYRCTKMTAKI